MSDIPPLSGM
jgi:NAD(P)-dependent dehydrogenase (short-subunit alcohol dehydrogenase family)